MDMTPAILIFTPIFLPVVKELGMDPIQFGIIMVLNLSIGLCTPPVGTSLFIVCGIADTTVAKISPHLIKFFIAMIVVLLLCTYVPGISMILPRVFGM
jgi:TRAP-type C4-dicarboxylate transport system permease large subunit